MQFELAELTLIGAREENQDRIATADGLLEIMRAVQCPWVGVNLDTGNFRTADPYRDLARVAPYAVSVQYKVEVTIDPDKSVIPVWEHLPTNGSPAPEATSSLASTTASQEAVQETMPSRQSTHKSLDMLNHEFALAKEARERLARTVHRLFERFEFPGVDEVFAVVRTHNDRGVATARRIGMEWVGETEKYYGLQLQVYRLRQSDLLD